MLSILMEHMLYYSILKNQNKKLMKVLAISSANIRKLSYGVFLVFLYSLLLCHMFYGECLDILINIDMPKNKWIIIRNKLVKWNKLKLKL